MIKVEKTSIYNFENAIRGMRNALESWDQSDSGLGCNNFLCKNCQTNYPSQCNKQYIVGENDQKLALNLIKAGSDHRKFMRQIFVSMDITAPITWWIDFDTYKVATVRNSTSRMHKLGTRLLIVDDFSWSKLTYHKEMVLNHLNYLINVYQEHIKNKNTTLAKEVWVEIIEDLPESYNYLSTWTGNFEVLRNIYHARKNHKQKEFRDFCKILEGLPYSEFITTK